jgi:hypothetical protein
MTIYPGVDGSVEIFTRLETNRSKKYPLKLQGLVKMFYAIKIAKVLYLVLNRMFGVGGVEDQEENQLGDDDELE